MPDGPDIPADLTADEVGDYLRIYVDETGEQADGLVETILALEEEPRDPHRLAEAFRLVHSIKGSAALLGLDRITVLAHHLETHFERLRSGVASLDQNTTNVALRFVDYLREGNDRLRRGEPLPDNVALLAQVESLGRTPIPAPMTTAPGATPVDATVPVPTAAAAPLRPAGPDAAPGRLRTVRVTVRFAPGMPLADLKAELVLARLGAIGTVCRSEPPRDRLEAVDGRGAIDVWLETDRPPDSVAGAADVDGAAGVDVADEPAPTRHTPAPGEGETRPGIQETVRVDVDRLDVLMNLAGELVVNRSRFVQVARELAPAFRTTGASARALAIAEGMRHSLDALRGEAGAAAGPRLAEMERHLEALEEQSRQWQEGRRHFDRMLEAIDQLARVSDNLQRGVLNTRMVAVAPLFNRFKRSVRDIARELGKRVDLEIRGERTELDKRMIDELGDPLVHLVRNAIDHGIEPADVRRRRGKPETATLRLEAFHRGNAVCVAIADDGGGIDTDRIRQRAVSRGLVTAEAAAGLAPEELVDFIWQPGFSTAREVSDISGRGVGMDIVRTRIARLSGSIEVASTPGSGTCFTIRLPLTLAIVRCMLFGSAHGVFAVPIEHIRGIVKVADPQVVHVNGRRVCDIRGEFLPLVDIHDIFHWAGGSGACRTPATWRCSTPPAGRSDCGSAHSSAARTWSSSRSTTTSATSAASGGRASSATDRSA